MQIHESAEDYLETILLLSEERDQVRSVDIANALGYSKPSISVAMKRLRERGCIEVSPEGYITLTQTGMDIAQRIRMRHDLLKHFLMHLGVPEETAQADACKMEHDLSEESFDALCAHARKYTVIPE